MKTLKFRLTSLCCLAALEITQPIVGWVILNGLDCRKFCSPRGGTNNQEWKDFDAVTNLYRSTTQCAHILRRMLGMKETVA